MQQCVCYHDDATELAPVGSGVLLARPMHGRERQGRFQTALATGALLVHYAIWTWNTQLECIFDNPNAVDLCWPIVEELQIALPEGSPRCRRS